MPNHEFFEIRGTTLKSSSNSRPTSTSSTAPSRSRPARRWYSLTRPSRMYQQNYALVVYVTWEPRDPPSPFHQFKVTHAKAKSFASITSKLSKDSAAIYVILSRLMKASQATSQFALLVRVRFEDHTPLDCTDSPVYKLEYVPFVSPL